MQAIFLNIFSLNGSRDNIDFSVDIETLVFSGIFLYFVPLLRVSFGIFALICHFIFSKSGLYEYDELSPIPSHVVWIDSMRIHHKHFFFETEQKALKHINIIYMHNRYLFISNQYFRLLLQVPSPQE